MANDLTIPILMYHSITDDTETGHPYFWINTSVKRFAEQMRFLKENKYKVISLADAVKILGTGNIHIYQNQKDIDSRFIVMTFDDGFDDFRKQAWPVMMEHGFSATVFVSTGFVGNTRKRFNDRECLTWSEIRELHSYGVSFGSHTVNHSKLYEMQWKEICGELLDSRLRLEDELQTSVVEFAYPYAFPQEDHIFVQRFRQELVNQGYCTAVTTAIGCAKPGSDPLCLERIPVNTSDDEKLFAAKIAGAYDWLATPQMIVRRTKGISRSYNILRTTVGT